MFAQLAGNLASSALEDGAGKGAEALMGGLMGGGMPKSIGNIGKDVNWEKIQSGDEKELAKLMKQQEAAMDDDSMLSDIPGLEVKGDDVNILGVMSLPREIVTMGAGMYNSFLAPAILSGQKGAYNALKANPKFAKYADAFSKYVPAAFILSHDGVKVYSAVNRYFKDAAQLTKQAAPFLQQMRGETSRSALMSLQPHENEVLYGARKKVHDTLNQNLIKAGITSIEHLPILLQLWSKHNEITKDTAANPVTQKERETLITEAGNSGALDEVHQELISKQAKIFEKAGVSKTEAALEAAKFVDKEAIHAAAGIPPLAEAAKGLDVNNMMGMMAPGAAGAVVARMGAAAYERSQAKKSGTAVTTFEMIQHLSQKFSEDPDRKEFSYPKGLTKENTRAKGLSEYVSQCFINLQKEMRPDAPIPKRQYDALKTASDKIASAIQNGEMDVMGLVNLVGERRILVNEGQRIDLRYVEEEIRRVGHDMPPMSSEKAENYFEHTPYTEEELKASFEALPADERRVLGLLVPPAVREHLGENPEQIREDVKAFEQDHSAAMAKVCDMLECAASKDEAALKQANWVADEIKQIQKLGKMAANGEVKALSSELHKPASSRIMAGLAVQEATLHGTIAAGKEVTAKMPDYVSGDIARYQGAVSHIRDELGIQKKGSHAERIAASRDVVLDEAASQTL